MCPRGIPGVFDSEFHSFGSGFYKAKALDDRAGCALLVELIQSGELPYDAWFSFSVQEETVEQALKPLLFPCSRNTQ